LNLTSHADCVSRILRGASDNGQCVTRYDFQCLVRHCHSHVIRPRAITMDNEVRCDVKALAPVRSILTVYT